MPLVGFEALPTPLRRLARQHVIVVIQGAPGGEGEGAAGTSPSPSLTTFDFLPINPTAPGTLIQMLVGAKQMFWT